MPRIVVLSPHRDDAAFSLYLSLRNWSQTGIHLTVLNFFTVSNYAPRVSGGETETVSLIRKAEDRYVLSRIHRGVDVRDCNLLDAPLRLGIGFDAVCRPETRALPRAAEPDIAAFIRSELSSALAIAPLGLGGHVDHLSVHSAAIASILPLRLAFYEDLPYATWTPAAMLRQKIDETEEKAGVKLVPAIIPQPDRLRRKQQAIKEYRSQISSAEAAAIARFSFRYGGGERIWIPKRSRAWKNLTAN